MNQRAIHTLEFDKIITALCDFATCPGGRTKCESLTPLSREDEIATLQQQTTDALVRILRSGSLSFSGTREILESLKRLEIGSTLGAGELLNIHSVLKVAARAKAFSRKEESAADDSIDSMFQVLEPLTNLSTEIARCIQAEDVISDEASPELRQLRRKIKQANDDIHSGLNSLINSQTTRTYLQDNVITMRNGRYCIPVKQEYRSQVPGLIHDQSSTGSTIFVEPMAIVKLNNTIKELSLKEAEEIERILADLSAQCGEQLEAIETDYRMLTELDFIFARASYSRSIKGSQPVLNTNGYINIKQGRHPLIPKEQVIPIDIWLGDTFDLLIVTGPNTGGKTVSLKTVGLFTLMGQSGLHIPADEGSSLSIFEEVYADIGDEQSIEQSLSTFSSHMTKIVTILEKADQNSLVLFDELGAGTDPVEGAALATSILSFLHNLKIPTIATTHYSELKIFALTTDGVENASCEFNVETLRPTYRLLIGIPGKSNAFAISSKLGLPDYIIEDARNRVTEDNIAFEDVISDLEESKSLIQQEKQEIEAYKAEIKALKQQLEKKHERLDDRRESILRSANEEAARILQNAKDFADQTVKEVNKSAKSGDTKSLEASRRNAKEQLSKTREKLSIGTKTVSHKVHKASDFKIGDKVKVLSMNVEGIVRSLPNNKNEISVQMGILQSNINIRDVIIIEEDTPAVQKMAKGHSSGIKVSKSMTTSTEIKLIGMNSDDAIAVLDKYLDDAYLSHMPSVRIVHGKGSGILRNAVHKYLKRCSYVKEFHLAEFGEGDAGVTIATFK